MPTTSALYMSRAHRAAATPVDAPSVPRSRLDATYDAFSFALVGIAVVGLYFETFDLFTDSRTGLMGVGAGALAGATFSLASTRLPMARADRLARLRRLAWDLVRLFVAFEMMRYGTAKLVGMQFYPRYYFLDTRPADMTPMALAWTFFGRTYGYQAISGAVEVVAAVLLCSRRTAALGACVLLAAMTNIVLLNFFYDVPVKLFSSIYLVMGLYVLTPDARRIWGALVGDGAVPPRSDVTRASGRPARPIAIAAVVALVLVLPAADIVHKAAQRGIFRADRLEGAWIVQSVTGASLPVDGRWQKIFFEKGDYGFVQAGSERVRFDMTFDDATGSLRMFHFAQPKGTTVDGGADLLGTYAPGARHVHIDAKYLGQPVAIELERELPR